MTVHWARDAAEHNQVVHDMLQSHGVTTLVKSKSMLTDECEMRPFLANRAQGIRTFTVVPLADPAIE
jgi:L-lactate dehydrogenase complex protein LldF